jgi:hypothetical protein
LTRIEASARLASFSSFTYLQKLTAETLFLAALPLTGHQNETERRSLYEILVSKNLRDSPGPVTDVGTLGIQRTEIRGGAITRTPIRFGNDYDLKGAAVFLASDTPNFVTGDVLAVGGGQSA